MKFFFLVLSLTGTLFLHAQKKKDHAPITSLLARQTEAWNKGDIEGFMKTYWKSDSLLFIGKTGVVRGWQKTLDNYKRGYPDTAAMGKLHFDIIEIKPLSSNYYFVVGKWMLHRTAGNLSGHYTLVLKRFGKTWKIIADHSS